MSDKTSTTAPEADAGIPEAAPAMHVTHFLFHHRVFQTPGARFLLKGSNKTPTFCVDMGDLEALIDIDVLKKEFGLPAGSPDTQMVDTAVAALRYVPDVKPGDTIPSELLTGKASWVVSPKHKRIAEQRLQVQLLSWTSGKELLLTDPKEIANFLEQLENREKLRKAFREAAAALGHGPENTEQVVKQLELLARELCYIEALRDRFMKIPLLEEKMATLAKSYGNDRSAKMELNRVRSLLQAGINEYKAMFTEVDAQTGEIISALKSIARQVGYIREMRDHLHFLIMQWDPHINDLDKWHTRPTPETDKALRNLYRFLAPRFTAGKSLLRHRSKSPDAHGGSEGTAAQKKKSKTGDAPTTTPKVSQALS